MHPTVKWALDVYNTRPLCLNKDADKSTVASADDKQEYAEHMNKEDNHRDEVFWISLINGDFDSPDVIPYY